VSGEWDALEELGEELDAVGALQFYGERTLAGWVIELAIARGDMDRARRLLDEYVGDPAEGDIQTRAFRTRVHCAVDDAVGEHERALGVPAYHDARISPLATRREVGHGSWVSAHWPDRLADAEGILALVEAAPVRSGPRMRAHAGRFRARIAARRGGDPEPGFKSAIGLLREIGLPYEVAQTQFEYGVWLDAQGRSDDARSQLEEAIQVFERLGARPALERARALLPERTPA
jgi:hypothetical protein